MCTYYITDNASNMQKAFTMLSQMNNCEASANAAEDENENSIAHDKAGTVREKMLLDNPEHWQDLNEDDTAPIVAVEEELSIGRLSCFAHTLNLVVNDSLQKAIIACTVTAKCVKLANLMHQSANVKNEFEKTFGMNHTVPNSNLTR